MITTSTIYTNTKHINDQNGMLDVAMECAAFLDQVGAFAFKNWMKGEIIEGPILDKFYVELKLMFPEKSPPDPAVIDRLTNINCSVNLEQDIYRRVAHVRSSENASQPSEGFERRLFEHNVWLLTLSIPEKYLSLDGNTTFEIEGEMISYEELEAVYIGDETESLEAEEEDGGALSDGDFGGDDDMSDFEL